MKHKKETDIQNTIRVALCQKGCKIYRCTVGNFYTKYGQEIKIGETGHSDLYGARADGKAIFLEVKTPIGSASDEQKKFIEIMKKQNTLAGFARSVEDAFKIVFPEQYS